MDKEIIEKQKNICKQYNAEYTPVSLDAMIGVSDNTDGKLIPINGLRHKGTDNTTGWFIWSGEKFSKEDDFFKPTHVKHLITRASQVLQFLALPPGYRFLIAGDYIDVWYDETLLEV